MACVCVACACVSDGTFGRFVLFGNQRERLVVGESVFFEYLAYCTARSRRSLLEILWLGAACAASDPERRRPCALLERRIAPVLTVVACSGIEIPLGLPSGWSDVSLEAQRRVSHAFVLVLGDLGTLSDVSESPARTPLRGFVS